LELEIKPEPEPTIEDILDDIAEKLDIIQAKVDELVAQAAKENEEDEKIDKEEEDKKELELEISCVGQININTALQKDLEKIIEVGPATAQKIMSARPFYLLDDLLKVSGIGEKTLVKIKEQNCAFVDSNLAAFAPIASSGGEESCVGKININTAALEQLKRITNIGDVKAQAIIDARPFASLDALLNVKGIGETILQKIKDQNCAFVEAVLPEPELPVEEKDITAPQVSFSLEPMQNSSNFAIDFNITDLSGTATPSGIYNYIFYWQEEGGEEWQEDAPVLFTENLTEATGSRYFTDGKDETTYNFEIQATDVAGNASKNFAFTKISLPKKILINEVQISSIEQRFVELYNPNEYEINLTDWYLQRKKEAATPEDTWETFVSSPHFKDKIILPNSYFLISREIEGADILLKDMALKIDNALALKNKKEEIIDKLGWGMSLNFENFPAPNPDEAKSISRIDGIDTDDNSKDFIISEPTPGR
jgi:competence ComEA-like helix-hairpin-helix protein